MFSDAGYAGEIFPLPRHLRVSTLFSFSAVGKCEPHRVPELRAPYADLDSVLSESSLRPFFEPLPVLTSAPRSIREAFHILDASLNSQPRREKESAPDSLSHRTPV